MQEGSSEATYVLVLVEYVEGLDSRHGGGGRPWSLYCRYYVGLAIIKIVLAPIWEDVGRD